MLNPVFVINYYHDGLLAVRLLEMIQLHHKTAEVLVIADGSTDLDVEHTIEQMAIAHHFGFHDRIKLAEFGGLWIQRYLSLFLSTDGTHLVRLDPDVLLWKPIQDVADVDILASFDGLRPNMGCSIMRRSAVERVLKSGLLSADLYRSDKFAYQRFGRDRHPHETESLEMISHTDRIFQNLIKRLSLTTAHWDDVYVVQRGEIAPGDWIATHPHPTF